MAPKSKHILPLRTILYVNFVTLTFYVVFRSFGRVDKVEPSDRLGLQWSFQPPVDPAKASFQRKQQSGNYHPANKPHAVTIAYAVTVTSCKKRELVMDGASVLQHSIHLNSIRTPSSGSKYDYQMVAFVHPDGIDCIDIFETLNYTIMIKEVPFKYDQIRGKFQKWVNSTGCCGDKEWLKLYAYTLIQYPVVAHLDLDCLILKPFDDLFDAMIMTNSRASEVESKVSSETAQSDLMAIRDRIPIMWGNTDRLPERIDFFFTRDYGMLGRPGKKTAKQTGVQGGFLIVRPDLATFQDFIDLLHDGNYTERQGWGEALGFGGYYGAGTIQGLAAMYYSHHHPEHAVELNRCIYNNMVDSPYPRSMKKVEVSKILSNHSFMNQTLCLTNEGTCYDCRDTDINEIYSVHLTNCYKPWHCIGFRDLPPLCRQLHNEWYRVRYLLEAKWQGQDISVPRMITNSSMSIAELSFGYCPRNGPESYRPIEKDWRNNLSQKLHSSGLR